MTFTLFKFLHILMMFIAVFSRGHS